MAVRIPSNAAPGENPAPRPSCPVCSYLASAEEYGQYQGEDSAAGAAPQADMENISGFPRSVAGVKLAATLREEEEGPVKLSVRAVPGYDAAAVCEKFGGGGHKGAAGAGLDMTLQEAIEAVKAAIQ